MLCNQALARRSPCVEASTASRVAARPLRIGSMRQSPADASYSRSRRSMRTISNSVAAPADAAGSSDMDLSEMVGVHADKGMSYDKQYDQIFAARGEAPLTINKPVAKPDRAAQSGEDGARKIAFSKDIYMKPRFQGIWDRLRKGDFDQTDYVYAIYMTAVHGLCFLAPATFSWSMVGLFAVSYFVTGCLGITLSYHRQLSHRSFQTPKWLEYLLAYCGVLAVQGDPIEWVSCHRYHHLHTDTPLDPHSTYEGFWWSHMGWLMDHKATRERVYDMSNAGDLKKQWFYNFIEKTYSWHVVASAVAFYLLGGLPALVWGFAVRAVWVYHVTWFVNSACHCWGSQKYDTGDLSMNNWWVGILAWGEGWHNNHHAFEFSARHGLEWWQLDITWMCIRAMQLVGLAKNVKLPSEAQKARLAFNPA